MRHARTVIIVLLSLTTAACAGLTQLAQFVQPPRFDGAEGQPAEIRFLGPSASMPAGGAGVRIWLEVSNPNPFGFTLRTLATTLSLDGSRAATGDFPLGLPLAAGQESIVPVDLSISFRDLPGLATALRQFAIGGTIEYQLDGTVGVDAGRLGTPTFGPMRLTSGDLRVVR